ncbi:MAG: VTT domain-containing protein [Chloroflexi bacterium]|nr:VTT domain-containing protein [Chloroflexota bacterium]
MNAWLEPLKNVNALWTNGQISEWGSWSYLVLAVFVAVEGPFATLLGAAAASAGAMRPVPVFLAASLGNLTADTLWYFLGYIGKLEWIFHFGQRLGLDRGHMERLQNNIRKHAVKVLFFAKLSMSLMIPSLIAAGLVKVPWRRWFPAVFGGEIIWTGALVLIGFYATEAIRRIEQGVEYLVLAATIVFVIFLVFLSRRILRESQTDDEESDSRFTE